MAKFKRFDPRNKRAEQERQYKTNRRDKLVHQIMASEKQRKTNDKVFHPREEEIEQ
jgi:hypothetical protein